MAWTESYLQAHALPLIGRHARIIPSSLDQLAFETTRAGLYRLRYLTHL